MKRLKINYSFILFVLWLVFEILGLLPWIVWIFGFSILDDSSMIFTMLFVIVGFFVGLIICFFSQWKNIGKILVFIFSVVLLVLVSYSINSFYIYMF